MKIQKDLREFIALMNSHEAEYVIVGGHAVAYHGHPRFTGDMDFFIRSSAENAAKVLAVLESFGFAGTPEIRATLIETGKVIQLGRAPNRIDLLTGISGVTFDEVLEGSLNTEFDGLPVRIIGFEDLIKNKSASGRPKDLYDLEHLQKPKGMS